MNIRPLDTMGGDFVTYITLENVKVPAKNLIGAEGNGFLQVLFNFNPERISIIVVSELMSRVAFAEALKWSIKRKTFGVPLHEHQAVRMKLAHMVR